MSNTWLVFPLIQVIISIIAGSMIGIYGTSLVHFLGGGIIQKIIWLISLLAFLLAAYTIIGLWGYFAGNDIYKAINHTLILIMSITSIIIGYYLKRFSDGIKAMQSGD